MCVSAQLHTRALLACDSFEECVKELSAPIECAEDDLLMLVDTVKVKDHWASVLERFQVRTTKSSRTGSDNEEEV